MFFQSLYLESFSRELRDEDRVTFFFADDQENENMLTWQGLDIFRSLFDVKSWQWARTKLDVSWCQPRRSEEQY